MEFNDSAGFNQKPKTSNTIKKL